MTRTRNYVFELYPDSAPFNWLSALDDLHVPIFVSPLHDRDFNMTADHTTPKKAHYHIVVMYDSVKTLKQAQEDFGSFAANGVIYPVSSMRGYARYLCHLDNPEKAQYSIEDVVELSGADYLAIIQRSADKYDGVCQMMDFCRRENVIAFSDLCDYARENNGDWFRLLCDQCTLIMREYIKSLYWLHTPQ